jgi:hypothetical protein
MKIFPPNQPKQTIISQKLKHSPPNWIKCTREHFGVKEKNHFDSEIQELKGEIGSVKS